MNYFTNSTPASSAANLHGGRRPPLTDPIDHRLEGGLQLAHPPSHVEQRRRIPGDRQAGPGIGDEGVAVDRQAGQAEKNSRTLSIQDFERGLWRSACS
jgi:hypothetical protein